MNNLEIILLLFGIYGLGWIILLILLWIFGGRVLIQLRSPITKKLESITDIIINHEKERI
ncbi:hypothetical protein [Bacillus sp. 03113]|uniref:hypothetical protein n=1 Tax=Bacillus sp. 03113 TaxID=2578211 RepID=UPI0015E87BA2|nr:hypothetical protein [Bacillus sp. 03113]